MRKRWLLRVSVLAGLIGAAVGLPASAASPEPSESAAARADRAVASVRAVDPRFADLPDYGVAMDRAVRQLDMAPILAGSWVYVLPTFDSHQMLWADLGRGLLVEVMMVEGCPEALGGGFMAYPLEGPDPCEWRRSWLYRVLPSGEVVLVSEGGSPDNGAP